MDSAYLSFALAAADNEVTGEAANLTDIKQDNIGGLLVTDGGDCFSGYIYGVQWASLSDIYNSIIP